MAGSCSLSRHYASDVTCPLPPVDGPSIEAELSRLRAAEKVREKAHNQKFKGKSSDFLMLTFLQFYVCVKRLFESEE